MKTKADGRKTATAAGCAWHIRRSPLRPLLGAWKTVRTRRGSPRNLTTKLRVKQWITAITNPAAVGHIRCIAVAAHVQGQIAFDQQVGDRCRRAVPGAAIPMALLARRAAHRGTGDAVYLAEATLNQGGGNPLNRRKFRARRAVRR